MARPLLTCRYVAPNHARSRLDALSFGYFTALSFNVAVDDPLLLKRSTFAVSTPTPSVQLFSLSPDLQEHFLLSGNP